MMLLQVSNVSKSISKKEIIKNISFSLQQQEIVALVGPNGSGKTTLLKLIATLLKLEKGKIQIGGVDIEGDRNNYLNEVSFMQDSSVLYAEMSGYDHLEYIAGVKGKTKKDISEVIKELVIEEYIHRKVKTYSLGMKQHLLLSLAVLSNPRLLLLDEPLNGLDPTSSNLLRTIIFRLRNQGTTILFSSHILSEVDKVSDRVLFIRNGELIHENLEDKKRDRYQFKVSSPINMINLLKDKAYVIELEHIDASDEILLTMHEGHFNDVLKVLAEKEIEVMEVSKKEFQSEAIYQRLYEEKV